MLTEHDSSRGGEDEVLPPFLLETTEFVRTPGPGPRRLDAIVDLINRRRPPSELLALFGLIGALLILYTQRPGLDTEVVDPLSASPAPSTITIPERSTSSSSVAVFFGDPADLGANADQSSSVRTLPTPTTVPTTGATRPPTTTETTTTTVETTTTTVETTTSAEETTTTAPETTTTAAPQPVPLGDCVIGLRNNTSVYDAPNTDNRLGRIPRGEYRAVARFGGWYQIAVGPATGWVEGNQVRDTKGDCG